MSDACIITTGSEIVEGIITDQNSKWLASKLISLGWRIHKIISVGDDHNSIREALECSMKNCDLIIITGGLGPTKDDITRSATAKFFKRKLIFDEKLYEKIEKKVKEFAGTVVKTVRNEAMIIEGAEAIGNDVGSAPGQLLKVDDGKIVLLLPGPPNEMMSVFSKVESRLLRRDRRFTRILKFYGIKESVLEDELRDIIYSHPEVKVAFQADYVKGITLRLTSSESEKEVVNSLVKKIYDKVGVHIYAEESKSLEEVVVELLKEAGRTLAVAESCTGGVLAGTIVNVPGSSKVFKGGIIAYDNSAKMKLLCVRKSTLERYGAVSEECVKEMLEGVMRIFDVDYAIAISGIAGPSGGNEDKPVGTVYIGVMCKGIKEIKRFHFKRERNTVRYKSAYTALDTLRRLIRRGEQ